MFTHAAGEKGPQSYNGSIRPALGMRGRRSGTEAGGRDMAGAMHLAASGLIEDRLNGEAGLRDRSLKFGERLRRIAAVADRVLETARATGHARSADRARCPLQRMCERAGIGWR